MTNTAATTNKRSIHFFVLLLTFLCLGGQVGIWAVLMTDLVGAHNLSTSELGFALGAMVASGLLGLILGGKFGDGIGRRPLLLLGIGGTGLFFILLTLVNGYGTLIAAFAWGGFALSFFDLVVNTLGGDYERVYKKHVLPTLHASFSAGAAITALTSGILLSQGIAYTSIYMGLGILLMAVGLLSMVASLPDRGFGDEEEGAEESGGEEQPQFKGSTVVIFAALTVAFCFLIDGALEGYLSIYLRDLLDSGALLGGMGIAALHTSGFIGRVSSAVLISRFGERNLLIGGGLLATAGLATVLLTSNPAIAACGLLVVGMGLSPVVPIGFSLAGRAEPVRGAQAVSIVTAAGYVTFIIGPVLIGGVAEQFSLRGAFSILLVASLTITLLAVLFRSSLNAMALKRHEETQKGA